MLTYQFYGRSSQVLQQNPRKRKRITKAPTKVNGIVNIRYLQFTNWEPIRRSLKLGCDLLGYDNPFELAEEQFTPSRDTKTHSDRRHLLKLAYGRIVIEETNS